MTAIDPYALPDYGRGTAGAADAVFPEVTVTVPAVLTTIPYTVTWDYDHPDGEPQTEYRVEIVKSGVVVYSSGWVASAATSHQITAPWELTDSVADIRMSVAAQNRGYQDTDTKTVTTQFGIPTVTWLYPDPLVGKIDETLVTVSWDYDDTQAKAQAQYRVVLEHGSEIVYDSTWLAGTDTTLPVPYLLSPGSRYRAGVKVRNTNQVESG